MLQGEIIRDKGGGVHETDADDEPKRGTFGDCGRLAQRQDQNRESAESGETNEPNRSESAEHGHDAKAENPKQKAEANGGGDRPGDSAQKMLSVMCGGIASFRITFRR